MEREWLREALFAGQTANGFKLGTVAALGWFWARTAGCTLLYRGDSMAVIDFDDVLRVSSNDAEEISPPPFAGGEEGRAYYYVVRRANRCGNIERTLAAAVRVEITGEGELAARRPNAVSGLWAEQEGDKVALTWYYCAINQGARPVRFSIYSDGGTGRIDYENAIGAVAHKGPGFYSFTTDSVDADKYIFSVMAEGEDGVSGERRVGIELRSDAPAQARIVGY